MGPLCDGGEKHARRRRHGQRCRVVLGDLVGVEPGPVVRLDQLETVLVGLAERRIGSAIEVVEDPEFDVWHDERNRS